MTRRQWLAAITVIVALAGGGFAAGSGSRDAEILAAIKERVDGKRSSGMVVATIEADGGTSLAAYGDPGPGARPLDGDSVFEIGSITKVFTATLLVDMADRGEVKLDEPVQALLPAGVKVPQRNGRQITLLDLATQSSGLPRLPSNLKPRDMTNPYADYTAAQLYDFLNGYELARDIGSQYEYSNLGVGLLGHALARRAGRSYEALVTERILKPLGMAHTGITLTPWMKEHLAQGHNAAGAVVPNWDVATLEGAGALRSTAHDMLRFARGNLRASEGRLQKLMPQAHAAQRPTGTPGLSVGLGWHIRRAGEHDIVWHNGGTGGYRTWMGFDAQRKIAAVVLTNSSQGADDLGYALLK